MKHTAVLAALTLGTATAQHLTGPASFPDLVPPTSPSFPTFTTPALHWPAPPLPTKDALNHATNTSTYAPPPSPPKAVFSFPDLRLGTLPKGKTPFLEVRSNDGTWTVPFSTVDASRTAATKLRRAWQRFEERAYWRAHTELNNLTAVPTLCLAGLGAGRLEPKLENARVTVSSSDVPASLRGKVNISEPNPRLHLDAYLPLPQVPPADFCDDLTLSPRLMYLPGGCTYLLGKKVLCLNGSTRATGPGASPLWFDDAEAGRRVASALKRVAASYAPQYARDVVAALSTNGLAVLPWASLAPGGGAFLAPVANGNVDPTPVLNLADRAGRALGGLHALTSRAYFLRPPGSAAVLRAHLAPGRTDVLASPPGVWAFEAFKRELPPASLPVYERVGYATFFQAWSEFETLLLPTLTAARPLRTLTFHAVALDTYLSLAGVKVVPVPIGIPVPPYLIPYAGPRTTFTWASVPEGYEVPRVKGAPAFDYRGVLR